MQEGFKVQVFRFKGEARRTNKSAASLKRLIHIFYISKLTPLYELMRRTFP